MSLLTASLRTPMATAALHHEATSSCTWSADAVSPRVAPGGAFYRGHFKKIAMPMHSPCNNINRVARLRISARQGEQIRSVPVQVAHELLNAGHRCLDVRTVDEYAAGHVEGAINIPYLVKVGPGMSKNERFLKAVEAEFGKDDEIIVNCLSGKRSMMAAAELIEAEFTGITDMGGGFSAWKESGLPVVAKRAQSHSL